MRRWRRRIGIAVGLVVAAAIVRTGLALWPPPVPPGREWAVLTGVTVINPGRDRRANQTLTIRDGRIASIVDRVPDRDLLPRARMYEDRYVLPGLIDMDVRHVPTRGPLQIQFGMISLLAGVTTVRDVGHFDGRIAALQQRIAAGDMPWPRLIACGRVLEGDPPRCRESRPVRDAADARRAVDELVAMGAGCVAVRRSLTGDTLAAVHAAARARGLPVVGEVPHGMPAGAAALDDVLLISAAPSTSPAPRIADWLRGWQAADAAYIAGLARAAAARGTAYTPSLLRWSYLTRGAEPVPLDMIVLFLPRFYRERMWEREMDAFARTSGQADLRPAAGAAAPLAGAVTAMRRAVRRLHAAGVRIHVGTGAPSPWVLPGLSIWSEMTQLAAAGLTPEDIWVAATRVAGESLGIPQLGVLEAGAPADLLVFRQDPTGDLAAFLSLEAVIAQGRLYPTVYLNRHALEYARYFQGAAYDRLSVLLARLAAWWDGDLCTDGVT